MKMANSRYNRGNVSGRTNGRPGPQSRTQNPRSAAGAQGGAFAGAGGAPGSRQNNRRQSGNDFRQNRMQEQQRKIRQAELRREQQRREAQRRARQAELKRRRAERLEAIFSNIKLFLIMFISAMAICAAGMYLNLNFWSLANRFDKNTVIYVLGEEITRDEARALNGNYIYYHRRYFSSDSHLWSHDTAKVKRNGHFYINFNTFADLYGFTVTGNAGEYSFITKANRDNSKSPYGDIVSFRIGWDTAVINGNTVRLPDKAQLISNEVWIPYEFINYYVMNMTAEYNSERSILEITPSDGKPVSTDKPLSFSLKYENPIPNIAENSLSDEILQLTDPVTVRALKEAKRQEELKKAAEEEARRAGVAPPPDSMPPADIVE
jgi:hypothetical protein